MAPSAIAVFFLLLLCSIRPAWAGTIVLGQSNQTVTYTGLAPNSNNLSTSRVSWGTCSFDGTNTNCNVTGPFTGLGPGGTYDFLLSYPGNGTSPMVAVQAAPGSAATNFLFSSGTFTLTFQESDGTTVSFGDLNYSVLFVPGLATCTGSTPSCGGGDVPQGGTVTGPIMGTFTSTPVIRTDSGVITASAYGAFTSIAPGTWIEIYGLNLAMPTEEWSGTDFQGNNAPTTLGGTTVMVGGEPAFVEYVSHGQVNAQVPSDVGTGPQQVIVTTPLGGASTPYSINVNALEPGLLAPALFDLNNTQYAEALFPGGAAYVLPPGAIASLPSNRAVPGDTIILYGVGFGPVTPVNPAGVIVQADNQLNAAFTISFAGIPAQVKYAGLAPGYVGLYQFNVVVPNVAPSDFVPVTFTLGGAAGQQTLFLPVGN